MYINKSVILVDCFDTVIHRAEHPYSILKKWAFCIARLYPRFQADEIFQDRFAIIHDGGKQIGLWGIYFVYEEMAKKYISQNRLSEEEHEAFVGDLKYFELVCESSAHYIDEKTVKILRDNRDKKIYCVTDYHLFSEDILLLLKRLGIDDLFDGVFSSASCGASKYAGSLYEKVLNHIGATGKECLMIGDNRRADIINARRYGIEGLFLPHPIHKSMLRIENKLTIIRKSTISKTAKKIWKASDAYEEYIVLFYVFSQRLYNAARKENIKKIVFLSREGYFLKRCFEIYQRFCVPAGERLKTDYLICSRRAIQSVQPNKCRPENYNRISLLNYFRAIGFSKEEVSQLPIPFDAERLIDDFPNSAEANFIRTDTIIRHKINERLELNNSAFRKYVESKTDGNILCLVDVGWHGSVQQGIEQVFNNIKTQGYYIGIYGDLPNPPYDIRRRGLIFHKSSDGEKSPYFYVFRSNIQIYEQLLSAPHGGGTAIDLTILEILWRFLIGKRRKGSCTTRQSKTYKNVCAA